MSADLRLAVDWTACTGHGLCAELLPERVSLDEWAIRWSRGPQSRPRPSGARKGPPPTARYSP